MQAQFLERTVDPIHFQSVAPFWVGSAEQVSLLTQSAAQLWLIPTLGGDKVWNPSKMLRWKYRSNNAFFAPRNDSPFSDYPWDQQFSQIHDLIAWHHAFVGIEWKQASKFFDFERQLKPEIKRRWQRGLNKWGEHWRGNFAGRQHNFWVHEPPLQMPTEHDKLEASFVMRNFLQDKLPNDEIEAMLRDALRN